MKSLWQFRFVLLLFLSCTGVQSQRVERRRTTGQVSEQELQQGFSDLNENDEIEIPASEIELTQMLVVDVPGVVLRGQGMNTTVLKCGPGVNHALYIRSGSVQVESFTIRECSQGSAVLVETDGRDAQSITFTEINFLRNDARESNGGAVVANFTNCSGDSCTPINLTFQNCRFERNRATLGGAIYAQSAHLTVFDSFFERNRAMESGGGVYLGRHSKLEMHASKFTHNRAIAQNHAGNKTQGERGGAIALHHPENITINASSFDSNVACLGGGALEIEVQGSDGTSNVSFALDLQNSSFRKNHAYCDSRSQDLNPFEERHYAGGAIRYLFSGTLTLDWRIQNCSFRRNNAHLGGAVQIASSSPSDSIHHMQNCTFVHNIARESGGAVMIQGTYVHLTACQIRDGRAVYGGGIFAWKDAHVTVLPSRNPQLELPVELENNLAMAGGAIFVSVRSGVNITDAALRSNVAYRMGGAIHSFDTMIPIVCRGVTFDSNRAIVGGAVSHGATSNVTYTSYRGHPTLFHNNTAAVGGAMYLSNGHSVILHVTVNGTEFRENRALKLEEREIAGLMQFEGVQEHWKDREVFEFATQDIENPPRVLQYLTDVHEGHGGALCFALETLPLFTAAEILFQNVILTQNTASVGGGMSVHMSDHFMSSRNRTSCFPTIIGVGMCQRFVLENVTVTQNRASYAGGLFLTHPEKILMTCNASGGDNETIGKAVHEHLDRRGRLDINHPLHCTRIGANEISDDQGVRDGADVGSNAAGLDIEGLSASRELQKVASGDKLTVAVCEDASDPKCEGELKVAVKDGFGQTIITGVPDANLNLVLECDHITGAMRYTAVNGIATIDNTRARGIGENNARLRIYSQQNPNININVSFSTRECQPGESKCNRNECQPCGPDHYSIEPERPCTKCDPHANCSEGGVAQVPVEEYWHSTPFSPNFLKCIYPEACAFENRTERLNDYYNDTARVLDDLRLLEDFIQDRSGTLPDFASTYPQCNDGYEGILCGSCQDGYGHSASGECLKCPSTESNRVIFISLSMFWIFVMIGTNCMITLHSMRTRVQLVKLELKKQAALGQPRRLERAPRIPPNISIHSTRSRALSMIAPSSTVSEIQTSITLSQELVTTVQLTETIKLLVNYFQVTGVALSLRVEWAPILHGLLTFENGLAGVASEALAVPYECHFSKSGSTPASISAIWLRMYTPTIVMTAFLLILSLYWLWRHWRAHLSGTCERFTSRRLITCAVVIFIVTVYFSYTDTVRVLLRTVNCITVDDDAQHDDHDYRRFAIYTQDRVWAEDTNLTCYQGDHRATGIAGAFGLFIALFSIVFIIFWLPLNKKKTTSTEFVARYWFIYQAYRKEWYTLPWEAVILTRKAMIAAVVVFSVHTSPNLQAAMCVGILVVNYMVQLTLRPFKVPKDHQSVPSYASHFLTSLHRWKLPSRWVQFNNALSLNELETASLFSSILVFYSVIIFNDDRSEEAAKFMIATLTFFVAFVFSMYMFYRLYCGLHVLLDLKLESANPTFMEYFQNGLGPIALLRKARKLLIATYWKSEPVQGYDCHRSDRIPEEDEESDWS